MLYSTLSVFFALLAYVNGDCYLHYPRGSNNRLNEQSANRNNANRMFDSQNNNRGGYNVIDLDPVQGFDGTDYMASFTEMYDFRFLYNSGELRKQYEMMYFEESWLSVTWTVQHGSGQNAKLNTHIVLQYICDTFPRAQDSGHAMPNAVINDAAFDNSNYRTTPNMAAILRKNGLRVELYNGGNTNTPDATASLSTTDIATTHGNNVGNNRGLRESEEWYSLCQNQARNYGLFHADQDLNGDTKKYTRQNPDGTRRGLECPEERDYYPYWNPTPFHDIAILTPDIRYCKNYIAPESQNVQLKYTCLRPNVDEATTQWLPESQYVMYNLNQTACEMAGGLWEGFKWNGNEPDCVDTPYSKVNHLGNVEGSTIRGGKQAHYDWQLPSYEHLTQDHYCYSYDMDVYDNSVTLTGTDLQGVGDKTYRCVRMMFRIRYNMSTMDYDPYKTNSSYDEYDDPPYVISPIENNPTVDSGAYAQGLRLAINTAQTGRTFQDNTHTFLVCQRPNLLDDINILNVGVRGKRGNIVQTFPATEYDFEPQHIFLNENDNQDCLHFQWGGSNTHNNGNPAGDGQAGNDGEGREGSDRCNLLQMLDMDQSYPLTYDKFDNDFFDYVNCYHPLYPEIDVSSDDARIILGTAGFYKSVDYAHFHVAIDSDRVLDPLLNTNSGAFRQGLICCPNNKDLDKTAGCQDFAFVSTRNNNFSNRSQKLKIQMCSDGNLDPKTLW